MTNPFIIDEKTSEGGSKNISIRTVEDFIQKGKITLFKLSDDQKFIEVNFANVQGQTFKYNKRFYLPKDASEYDSTEKYAKAIQIFMGNMANVARKIKGEDYKVEGTSALDVAKKVITAVSQSIGSKEIFCFIELEEKKDNGGIWPSIGSFSPFGNTKEDLLSKVNSKQKDLLSKRDREFEANKNATPDEDRIPSGDDFKNASADLPF